MRASMLDVINSDYVRTAWAKGVPEYKVTLVTSAIIILANRLADVSYGLLDPRIRLS